MPVQCPTCHGSGDAPFNIKLADRNGTCPRSLGKRTVPGRESAGARAVAEDWQPETCDSDETADQPEAGITS
mgnify:CR=1 FL=1